MVNLFILNEKTIFYFIWCLFRRSPIYVLEVNAHVELMQPAFKNFVRLLTSIGLLKTTTDLDEIIFSNFSRMPYLWKMRDYFSRVESFVESSFEFSNIENRLEIYELPYKCAVVNGIVRDIEYLQLFKDLSQKTCTSSYQIVGLTPWFGHLYAECHNESIPFPVRWSGKSLLANILNSIMVFFFTIFFIAWKMRFTVPPPKPVLLGLDGFDARRQVNMASDILDDVSSSLVVFRNKYVAEQSAEYFAPLPTHPYRDGVFSIPEAVKMIARTTKYITQIWFHCRRIDPRIFSRIIRFPYYQCSFRALMNKCNFSYFLSRDEYNVEHIFRSREIRRQGGISLGINHGLCYQPIIEPAWRYIDYDIFYVFGEDIYRNNYMGKWPKSTKIKSVGSFSIRREKLSQLLNVGDRSNNIVVFLKPWLDREKFLYELNEVALAFTDRQIIVKVKPRRDNTYDEDSLWLESQLKRLSGNIVMSSEDSFDLMSRHRYCISGASTIVVEAIQFHMVTFFLDTYPADSPIHYRNYPGLCHTSSSSIVDGIRDIENGNRQYTRKGYAGLVDISGQNIFDIIRHDIGLPEMNKPQAFASLKTESF